MIKAEHKMVLELLGKTFEITLTDYIGFLSDCRYLLKEEGWLDEPKVADEVETSTSLPEQPEATEPISERLRSEIAATRGRI